MNPGKPCSIFAVIFLLSFGIPALANVSGAKTTSYTIIGRMNFPSGYDEQNYPGATYISTTNTIFMSAAKCSDCEPSFLLPISGSTGALVAPAIRFDYMLHGVDEEEMEYDSLNSKLFVLESTRVAVISTSTDNLVANFTVPSAKGTTIFAATYDSHNNELYVARGFYVDAFNAATNGLVSKILITTKAYSGNSNGQIETLLYDQNNHEVYVGALYVTNKVAIPYLDAISDSMNKITKAITVPSSTDPVYLDLVVSSNLLYVWCDCSQPTHHLLVLNATTNKIISDSLPGGLPDFYEGRDYVFGDFAFIRSGQYSTSEIEGTLIVGTYSGTYGCDWGLSSAALGANFLSCEDNSSFYHLYVFSAKSGAQVATINDPISSADLTPFGYNSVSNVVYAYASSYAYSPPVNYIYEISG